MPSKKGSRRKQPKRASSRKSKRKSPKRASSRKSKRKSPKRASSRKSKKKSSKRASSKKSKKKSAKKSKKKSAKKSKRKSPKKSSSKSKKTPAKQSPNKSKINTPSRSSYNINVPIPRPKNLPSLDQAWLDNPANNNKRILFYDRNAPFYWLTNFYQTPIKVGQYTFPTSEHLFQAAKFYNLFPPDVQGPWDRNTPQINMAFNEIMADPNPRNAFNVARKYSTYVNPLWHRNVSSNMGYANVDAYKDLIMMKALEYKFANGILRQMLKDVKGRQLVEHTMNDIYWADGGNDGLDEMGKPNGSASVGRNKLGKLLTELSSRL